LGSDEAFAVLDTDQQNLLGMPFEDSVREIVKRTAKRDQMVGALSLLLLLTSME